jgi:outer membrane protein
LRAALGVSRTSDFSLADSLSYHPVADGLDALVEKGLRNRSELSAAKSKTAAAKHNVDVAKGAYSPQVYASAMEGITSTSDGSDSGLTAGIAIGIPLVDGGQRRAAVSEAEAMFQAMKSDEQQAIIGIERDVQTAWAQVQAADRNVGLSEAAVEQAREDYRVIKLRYEAGKAINVEVLDALASLVRAQNNRLMALYEHSIAGDNLARATGGL